MSKQILRLPILIFTAILAYSGTNAQVRTYYHAFSPTDSDPVLTKWDITLTPQTRYYVIEKVDKFNRVISIRFTDRGHTYKGGEAGFTPYVTFAYKGHQIIETNYDSHDSLSASIEAGPPTVVVYTIDSGANIVKVASHYSDRVYSIYGKDFPRDSIAAIEKQTTDDVDAHAKFVESYIFSKAKLNGKMPTVANYDWQRDAPQFYPPGSDSVVNGH